MIDRKLAIKKVFIMKLRSGKILLPQIIREELNKSLKDLKALLTNNEEFAQELVKLIAFAPSIETRFKISDMIRRAFHDVELENGLRE